MLDFKTGAEVWTKDFKWDDLTPESHLYPNQTFLTDNICGFIFTRQDARPDKTIFELLLLDAESGAEVHRGKCWEWKRKAGGVSSRLKQFEVVAGGDNVVCIANVGRNFFDCASVDPRSLRMEECEFWKLGEEVSLLCARYDPGDGSCQVRKTSTSLEQALLAKCMEMEGSACAKGQMSSYYQESPSASSVELTKLSFHGIAGGATVLGEVRFNHHAKDGKSFPNAGSAFTIDLDVMLEAYEPAATFSGISFPLNIDVLLEKSKCFGFCPYYKSSQEGVIPSGLVAIDGEDKCPMNVTVHSFQTALEWTKSD